jgi:hypothetical protein
MPGLLNSSWLALAFCVAVYYLRSPAHSAYAGRLQRVLALGCVLALLFPVISANDDLLQQQMASEAGAASRIIKGSADSNDSKPHFVVALLLALTRPVVTSAVEQIAGFEPPVHCTLRAHATGDRSPPQT